MRRLKIAVATRDPNPYQESLYGPMRAQGADVRYVAGLTLSQSVNLAVLPVELLWLRLTGYRILHLHWTFGFRFPLLGPSRRAARLNRRWFVIVLRWAALIGMRIVWTAHNSLPHEPVFDDDVEPRRFLLRTASLIVAHSASALDELSQFGTPVRTAVIPHGPLGPAALRAIPPPSPRQPRTVTFFGRVAPYKGITELLAAMRLVKADLRLVIAGACDDGGIRDELLAAAGTDPRIELRLRHIPDDQLVDLFEQTDALVLPFRAITTSGSLLLGMSSARVPVVPDLPALRDLPPVAVFAYDQGVDGLASALSAVATIPGAELRRRGLAAREFAGRTSWAEIARRTEEEYRELLSLPRRGRLPLPRTTRVTDR